MNFRKQIESFGKKFLIAIIRLFIRSKPKTLNSERINKILVVRQDERIGNMLLATPALKVLRSEFKHARIDGLISKKFSRLWENLGFLDNIISFDKRSFLKNPLKLLQYIKKIRKTKYDLAIDLSSKDVISLNGIIFTYLSGASIRLGYKRKNSLAFLNYEVDIDPNIQYEAGILAHILSPIVRLNDLPNLMFNPTKDELNWAENQLEEYSFINNKKSIVGVNLGARENKQWGISKLIEVAERISTKSNILIFYGPEEMDDFERITIKSENIQPVKLSSIGNVGSLISKCRLFVSNDTGLLHLASAVNVPTVAIFMVDNVERYNPPGQKAFYPPPTVDELTEYILGII
jgi:heptosyltransferase-2